MTGVHGDILVLMAIITASYVLGSIPFGVIAVMSTPNRKRKPWGHQRLQGAGPGAGGGSPDT